VWSLGLKTECILEFEFYITDWEKFDLFRARARVFRVLEAEFFFFGPVPLWPLGRELDPDRGLLVIALLFFFRTGD